MEHCGVDPLSIVREAWQNISNNRIVSGGSTLTMQVARLTDPHQRSIPGKLKQILRALQIEWHLNKKQILEYYINHAPFGGAIEGVEATCFTYLGKSAGKLSHAEATLLTVLPQSPTRSRPDLAPASATKARNKCIRRGR